MLYYIASKNGEQLGPYTYEELTKLNISRHTLVWHEGLSHWDKAENINSIKHIFAQTPPPLPSPPRVSQHEQIHTSPSNALNAPALQPVKKKTTRNVLIAISIAILTIILFIAIGKQIRESNERKNEELQHIKKSLSVSCNYQTRGIGGVLNVVVRVDNPTGYFVDEAVVELIYLKRDGDIHKREVIAVSNIGMMSSNTSIAPDSDRGVSVNVRLLRFQANGTTISY